MDIFDFCAGPFKELISSSPDYISESIIKDNESNWQVKLTLKLYCWRNYQNSLTPTIFNMDFSVLAISG